ncbi:MAG TPA: fused MFS/spermidine synthase [Syntrophales bacterium]|nr:fused MFS/spermidine synthase [Syntrophales bacterium]HOX94511.1 fused MFS/spermidine synthase [Syntrophales bacterium]HPI57518.1 fused MFS/spermidine synthase [Syntrophales bacterium]HPN24675.1 fused MFS/spermidine synthase [Syntrophales bacterium]HQM29806.1 fused MFS/spermidine synthase [Syntrophales bacterium]
MKPGESGPKISMALLTLMVFVGALLLFGMEPLVGRLLTPYFGGAAHVWLTCLMFYQAMLMVGYLYAHLLARKLGGWHLVLLLLPLVNLPLTVRATPDAHAPLLQVLVILFVHVAIPFIVLSTTAVVAQSWLSHSSLGRRYEPYPLYSASNAGSLIALLGYTFIAEPLAGVRLQTHLWTAAYVLYVVIVVLAWFHLRPARAAGEKTASSDEAPLKTESRIYVQWLLLSSLPSALLLAVTNYIALEIGSFPLTWIAPLALYLGSFIVTFRTDGGIPRYVGRFWPEMLFLSFFLYVWESTSALIILVHLIVFFLICLVANGRLYEIRPPARHLTNYYLAIAFGGWLGGAAVSLIAPFVFKGLYEYPLLMLFLAAAFWWCRGPSMKLAGNKPSRAAIGARLAAVLLLGFFIVKESLVLLEYPVVYRHRNFYGTYRVKDLPSVDLSHYVVRKLIHGMTLHGAQLLQPEWRLMPIYYYYLGGGISQVYTTKSPPRDIAVLGLGAGAVAAYAKEGDRVSYYEIDPDNEKIARRWFTFLEECEGEVRVIVGDGRLAMQVGQTEGRQYDIIHMDAFTGDGIPTHLLTREAVEIYLSRLAKGGVILFHVSNRYYELRPVIKATARELGLNGAMNIPPSRDKLETYQSSTWCVALARDPRDLRPLLKLGWVPFGKDDGLRDMAPWTDDYINILAPLGESIKNQWQNFRMDTWLDPFRGFFKDKGA